MAVTVTRPAGAGTLVLAVADRHRARFAAQFKASMQAVSGRITERLTADAMAHPAHLSTIWQMLDAAPLAKAADPVAQAIAAYAEMASQAGKATLSMWVTGASPTGAARAHFVTGLSAKLDVKSPFMQQAARDMTAKLVKQVGDETKRAIRGVILQAVKNGASPYETSVMLRNVVGLTSQQALAVMNYRNGLIEARDGTRSIAGLRGAWTLSPKVPLRATLNPDQVAKYTDRYSARLLDYRAYNIARTETLYAANMGQQLTWQEMGRMGMIDTTTFRRVWSVVDDDRLCDLCAPMDGQTVALEEDFAAVEKGVLPSERTPLDEPITTEVPPLHPSCRCIIVAENIEGAAAEAEVPYPAALLPPLEAVPEAVDPFGVQTAGFDNFATVAGQITDNLGEVRALAFDSGDIEKLEVRLAQVLDDGNPITEVQFKLTAEAKQRLLAEAQGGEVSPDIIDAAMRQAYNDAVAAGRTDAEIDQAMRDAKAAITERPTVWTNLRELSIPKRVGNEMKFADPAYLSPSGNTYEQLLSDGTRIRFNVARETLASPYAFDGLVQAWLPGAPDDAALARLMGRFVTDTSYPSDAAAREFATNQAAQLFRTEQQGPLTPEIKARALEGAKRVFGLNPDDLILAPGTNGQIEVRLPPKVVQAIQKKTGVTAFSHSATPKNTVEQTVQMTVDMIQGGLKSTTIRWTEGIGGSGASSPVDVVTGGADYAFTRQLSAGMVQEAEQGGRYAPTFILDGEKLLARTDWYSYESDQYGALNPKGKSGDIALKRNNLRNLGDGAKRYSGQETMFRNRIGPDAITAVRVPRQQYDLVISELERRGITEVNGIPIRKFVRVP